MELKSCDDLTKLTWYVEPTGRVAVTESVPLVPSTLSASVCLYTPCWTKVTAKVVGSVLTDVQVTVLGPEEDHAAPRLGPVIVIAKDDAARERKVRKWEACMMRIRLEITSTRV